MPELRESGIDVLGEIPWGSHFCNFYQTKEDLLDTLIPYFKTGLENHEFCLWIISKSGLITMEEAKEALKQVVPDLERHLSNNDIEILNENEWYLEEDVISLKKAMNAWHAKLKHALALGYVGMRASGDTFWLSKNNWNDFFDYEKQVSDSIRGVPMTILCTYPLAKSGATEILDVANAHQFAIARRRGEWEVIETIEQLQAKAEIKRLNEELQRVKDRAHKPPLLLRYVVAVLSATASLIITLWIRKEVGQQATPIVATFLCAIMYSAWFGGVGPGLLTFTICLLGFDYCFISPVYSWAVDIKEIPRLLIFMLSALFVGLLSVAQRNISESLRKARDVLNETVQKLKQTNAMLQGEIVERKKSELLIISEKEEIRRLTEHLQNIREEERIHIAREIHDELGQQLTAIKMDVVWINKKIPEETTDIKKKLQNIIGLLDGSNQSIRRILSELRPRILDDHGLLEAIEWLGSQFTEATGIPFTFTTPEKEIKVSEQIATCIFRICQEAFTNITRYAVAKNVSISIKIVEENIVVIIDDDGIGFDTSSVQKNKSFGILGMKERVLSLGGKFELISSPGKGTKIFISLPLSE